MCEVNKDHVLIRLRDVLPESGEGSLLNNLNPWGMAEQLRFLTMWLIRIAPNCVVEVGTNRGYFGYWLCRVLSPGSFEYHTIDVAQQCSEVAEILEDEFNAKVTFIHGDAAVVLPITLEGLGKPVDIGYVDGYHDYNACSGNLLDFGKANARYILLDDCAPNTQMERALNDFLASNSYAILDRTDSIDDRGMVLIGRTT